jgi:hypothetical protein
MVLNNSGFEINSVSSPIMDLDSSSFFIPPSLSLVQYSFFLSSTNQLIYFSS